MKSPSSGLLNFTLTSKNLRLAVTILAGSDFLINVPRESDWNAVDVYGHLSRCQLGVNFILFQGSLLNCCGSQLLAT